MINNKAELTFATALRSILRQDPDIIMIGEIRDEETAESVGNHSFAVQGEAAVHFGGAHRDDDDIISFQIFLNLTKKLC